MENFDLSHPSRHAWNMLKKLDPQKQRNETSCPIDVDTVAKQIKMRGQHIPNHNFERGVRKEYKKMLESFPKKDPLLNLPVTADETHNAIKMIKNGKAAGIDGIYPDMITHLGPIATQWLATVMTEIQESGKIPNEWKHSKVIAILKPGKPANEPSSYRPISLLCVLYKLLERILLTRLTLYIDHQLPPSQAGFRPNRNTTEQILALTTIIESGFERRKKTGVVLVDLSAAYDTVWIGGLKLKLAKLIPCQTTLKLLSTMLGTRQYHVILGGNKSKTRKIKNGVPQGSVLAPTLFNVYIRDMPETKSVKLGYADDWALSYQSKDWEELESVLSRDTTDLKQYFDKWYLKMNMTKTVSSVFHLNNKQAQNPLTITVDNKTLPIEREPKYLGVTLDRTLSYKAHIQGIAKKVNKRNCIIRKIAGTSWGAKQSVLRTSGLALCYSAAEYAAPVWSRSSHTHQIDTKLRDTMRTISGCLKSTPNNWLPVTSAIAPPHLRREEANQKFHAKNSKY